MNSASWDSADVVAAIALMGALTWGLRALPFVAERWLRDHPVIARVRAFLPAAIMTLLLAHTLWGSQLASPRWPWAELVCVAVVMVVQWRARHALLSIFLGTGLYLLWLNPAWWA